MGLKDNFVEVFQPVIAERVDEVCLDQILFDFGSLLPPISLLQWQVAMFDEPLEGDCTVDDGLIPRRVSAQFGDLVLQLLPRLRLRHICLKPQNKGMSDEFRFVGLRVELRAPKTTMPFLSPRPDPSFLI